MIPHLYLIREQKINTKAMNIYIQQNWNVNLTVCSVWCAFREPAPSENSSWAERHLTD